MNACTVAWTETDPQLPHDDHQCVFNTTRDHTRHECRCGLNLVERARITVDTCGLCMLPIALVANEQGLLRLGMQAALHHVVVHKVMPVDWYEQPAAQRIWASWRAA